jgi:NADH-quinone oxidoreductase subunit D
METQQQAETLLQPWRERMQAPEQNRIYVSIRPDELLDAVRALHDARWGYLSTISGIDPSGEDGEMEALYHFCSGPTVVTLRVALSREHPATPSVCAIIPSASIQERELIEMFGIDVVNTPDRSLLYLPDDWPEEIYPLRRDFDAAELVKREPRVTKPAEAEGETFVVPIGPQHPALKEPAHFEFTLDGEIVTGASVRLGYAHRGIERATQNMNWTQNLYLLERVCGICSHIHAQAYCLGVEHLAGVEVPARARVIREIVAGLERIHSHLLWFGVAAHEAGFDTLFMYSWRDRETVMDLLEEISGNRVNYSINVLGGVKYDITPELTEKVYKGIEFLDERVRHYLNVSTKDTMFLQRTRGIGVMTKEQAEELGALGPTARASGVLRDIRVDAPYGAYLDFPIEPVVATAGDLETRFIIRLEEIRATIVMIREMLENLPEGELTTRMPRRVKAGETISRVEAPRGELFYYIRSAGGETPERIKIRTPTILNLGTVIVSAVGHQFADMPMILAGVDPCFSCNDRAVAVRSADGDSQKWSWERLRQYGIERYR